MKLNSLEQLYREQILDLYDAESQLVDALPKMAKASSDSRLKQAFESHLEETKKQRDRLGQIISGFDGKKDGVTCKAMRGLIAEGEDIIKERDADDEVRDAALIAAAQRVEHYEIAGYGTARQFAKRLGRDEDVNLLNQTLSEEKAADEKLNDIAIGGVNVEAQRKAS